MDAAPFTAPRVNTLRAAVEGEADLPDGSHLIWALSRREFGPMSFADRPEWDVASNRLQFLRLWNLKLDQLVAPVLAHTNNVQVVTAADAPRGARNKDSAFAGTDALLTRDPGLILMTTHADCLPLWLCEPGGGWIGLAHVGWRGLLAGMVRNLILAVPPDHRHDLHLALGPGISAKNYRVGPEVARQFLRVSHLAPAVAEQDGGFQLDLAAGVIAEAERENVSVDTRAFLCTFDTNYVSSFRRDGESFAPMAAFIVRLGGR